MNLADYPQMLPFADLVAMAREMRWRPGWHLSVFMDPHEGPKLRAVGSEPDGYHPGQVIALGISARIPSLVRTEADFLEWVLWRLLEVDAHECREMFRYRGELVRDPHDPVVP